MNSLRIYSRLRLASKSSFHKAEKLPLASSVVRISLVGCGLQSRQHHDYGSSHSGTADSGRWRSIIGTGAAVALGGTLYYSLSGRCESAVHAAPAASGPGAREDFMLYWASGSPYCWRIMIVLEEKGLSGYGHKLLTFADKGFNSPEVGAINPRHQAPSFRHGKIIVNESIAACDYLEATFKKQGTKLIPDDRVLMALVLQRKDESANLVRKGLLEVFFYTLGDKVDQTELNKRKSVLKAELDYWENYLSKGGPYLAGAAFSMADVAFFPVLALMVRMGLRLTSRPRLQKYYDLVAQRPSVQASWPPHWLQGPPTLDVFGDV